MRGLSVVGLIVACACGARGGHPPPPTQAPMLLASPPAEPVPAVTASAPPPPAPLLEPIPAERFEPARRFIQTTKLDTYSYHQRRIGNVEGYLAPILLTADGGFLVVGTRADYPGGKYQVGKSRPVVAKLDAAGAPTWERAYRTRGFLDYEGASAAELDDGYVVYVLSYVHPGRGAVVRLLRIDLQGAVVWDTKLRGQGKENTPFAQNVRLRQDKLFLDGHIYKDSSDTAYGWTGTIGLDGKVLSDEVGAANPYDEK
ncbi:MAG: hypothetical protein HS104_19980 [Polyangiaceae bacterium]|nr:hypothetical protein [Polyangiaceae bacterium]